MRSYRLRYSCNKIVRRVVFALLGSVVLVGCAMDKQTQELLRLAEDIAMEMPDSALRVVEGFDPTTIRGKHYRAHYQLVVAEAHYYNRLAVDRDSIAQPLFDYYIESDNHAERARAMYQHALVMQAEGENARAMFSLMEAEKSLSLLDNPRLLGLVHRTKGEIYGTECLFQKALEEYQKSAYYFDSIGLKEHSIYSKYKVAYALAALRKHTEAIELFSALEEESNLISYKTMITDILIRLCYAYIEISDYDSCQDTYNRITELNSSVMCDYYCIGAIIKAYNQDFDNAYSLLQQAEECDITIPMHLKYAKFLVLSHNQEYQKALEAYKDCIDLQDKSVLAAINDSILYDEIDFIESELAHNTELRKRNKTISLLSIALLIAIGILTITRLFGKLKSSKDEIANLKEQVESTISYLREKHNHIKQLTTNDREQQISLSKAQRRLDEHIYNNLQNIGNLLDAYYSDATKSVKREQLIRAVDSYVQDFSTNENGYATVERLVNEYRNGIVERLRDELPNLKEEEYRLLCLIYADFSSNAICLFMGYDKNKFYKRKNYLKGILTSSKCKSKKEFIQFL